VTFGILTKIFWDIGVSLMADFDRLAVLAKYAPDVAERIELISPNQLSMLDEVECGVLFVMAFWSVPSIRMFSTLAKVLYAVDRQGRARLLVIDTDDIGHLNQSPPFNEVVMGGNGETFWIHQGRIVSNSGGGLNLECLAPNTQQLLIMCEC
jgi:hypothetical protein